MKHISIILTIVLVIGIGVFMKLKDDKVDQKRTLVVKMDTNGVPPYSKEAPVTYLYSSLYPVLGQLLYVNKDYDLDSGLLKSFNWDHRTNCYRLKLKEGLHFHNGRKATAVDLEFSILRSFFTSKRSYSWAFFNSIKGIGDIQEISRFKSGLVSGVRITGHDELEITLKSPNPSFLHSLARPMFSLVPEEELEESDYEVWKKWPIGVGNYKISKVDQKKQYFTLEKIASSGPDLIEVHFSSEASGVDLILEQIKDSDEYRTVFSKKSLSVANIMFNYNSDLGKNIHFREAIHYGIDRDSLANSSLAFVANKQFLASHLWGRIEEEGQEESTDIVKAKALLARVKSVLKGEVIKIPIFGSSIHFENEKTPEHLKIIEDQLKEIGLAVKFFKSHDKYFDKNDKETPFRIVSLGADIADPIILFNLMKGKESPLWPHFAPNDHVYHQLLGEIEKTDSLKNKVLATKNLSQYFYDNKISVPLFEEKGFVSFKVSKVKSLGSQEGGLTFYLNRVQLK